MKTLLLNLFFFLVIISLIFGSNLLLSKLLIQVKINEIDKSNFDGKEKLAIYSKEEAFLEKMNDYRNSIFSIENNVPLGEKNFFDNSNYQKKPTTPVNVSQKGDEREGAEQETQLNSKQTLEETKNKLTEIIKEHQSIISKSEKTINKELLDFSIASVNYNSEFTDFMSFSVSTLNINRFEILKYIHYYLYKFKAVKLVTYDEKSNVVKYYVPKNGSFGSNDFPALLNYQSFLQLNKEK